MFDLNSARIYVCVVEEHGFTAASERLEIPKQTISRRIAELEEQLGVRLLERSTRKVRPTNAGELFLNYAQQILHTAEQAQEVIKETKLEPSGTLHLAASHFFSDLTLQDVILQYMNKYPKMKIEVTLVDNTLDLYERNIDIAFVIGPIRDSSVIAKNLAPSWLKCFAAPSLLEKHGTPIHPSEVGNFPIISYTSPMFGPKNVWQFTRNGPTDAEQLDITLSPQLSTPSFWMVRQACIDGLGIARMPSALCQYQVAQEQLQPLFPDWTMVFGNLTAIFPSRRMLSLPVRTFLDEVVNVIHQLPPTISLEDLENAWSSTEFIAPHSIRHLQ